MGLGMIHSIHLCFKSMWEGQSENSPQVDTKYKYTIIHSLTPSTPWSVDPLNDHKIHLCLASFHSPTDPLLPNVEYR